MTSRHELTGEQVKFAVNNKEFSKDIISEGIVIVIMTQDWCPQWSDMKNWIYSMEFETDVKIYEFIYNRSEYFMEFMRFKEKVFRNSQIPYLRIYKDGLFVQGTNYISAQYLQNLLKKITSLMT